MLGKILGKPGRLKGEIVVLAERKAAREELKKELRTSPIPPERKLPVVIRKDLVYLRSPSPSKHELVTVTSGVEMVYPVTKEQLFMLALAAVCAVVDFPKETPK